MTERKRETVMEQQQEDQATKLGTQSTKQISLPPALTVKQLGELLEVNAVDIIKQLMRNGMMANINQTIDFNVASIIADNFGFKVKQQPAPVKPNSAPAAQAATP